MRKKDRPKPAPKPVTAELFALGLALVALLAILVIAIAIAMFSAPDTSALEAPRSIRIEIASGPGAPPHRQHPTQHI